MGLESPCRRAYEAWCGEGGARQSWDPLTLLAAVRGPGSIGTEDEGKGGRNVIDQRGNNLWREVALNGTNQSYLVMKVTRQHSRNFLDDE